MLVQLFHKLSHSQAIDHSSSILGYSEELTSGTLEVGQGDWNINSYEMFPWRTQIPISWCWLNYFTSYCNHKRMHGVDLSNLESTPAWPKYELIRDLPMKNPSRWCWVNYFTSYQIHKLILCVDLSDLWKYVKVTQMWTHLIHSHEEPKYRIRWCSWFNYFTNYHVHKLMHCVDLSDLKVGQGYSNTNSSETFP